MSGYLATCIAVLVLAPIAADPPSKEMPPKLATFDEVQKRLEDGHLRLLDARPKVDYDKGHFPGAVWVDSKAVQALATKPGGLTDREAWAAWVASLGIGPETEVLVYDANRQLDAARVWWLLRYLGADQVGLINGNFPLWAKQDRPVSTETPKVAAREFPVRFRNDRSATRADVLDVLKKAGSARVVDARSEGEHLGTRQMSKRAGHIPTSCHLEWNTLVDDDGRFLDETALRSKLDSLGIKPGESVITHCQGGGRASVDAYVFERLGFPTRNYYPGWSDWGNAEDTPVEKGKK